jgi:hypothetical protein
MGAPVASGTLAGSTSGSSASIIHRKAARSDFFALGRHLSGRPTRTTLSTDAGSTEPSVVRSLQFRDRRGSRQRSRRDYRNRGKGISRPEQPRELKQSRRAQALDAWILGDSDNEANGARSGRRHRCCLCAPGRRRSAPPFRSRLRASGDRSWRAFGPAIPRAAPISMSAWGGVSRRRARPRAPPGRGRGRGVGLRGRARSRS